MLIRKYALRGDTQSLKSLLGTCPEVVKFSDSNGATPLHHAAFNGHTKALRALLNAGADVNAADSDGCTATHNAAFNGHTTSLRSLIEHGANVNHKDSHDDSTALHKAAFNGHQACLQVLLDAGADLFAMDSEGLSALQKAAFNDHVDCMEVMLLSGGLKLLQLVDSLGSSALHKCAFNGHSRGCQLLIDHGSAVDCLDHDLVTPLHNAAFNNHVDCLKILLRHNADPNKPSKSANTALHYAALNGHDASILLLVEQGASPEARDVKGLTPLHYAVKKDSVASVATLLEHGADPRVRDNKNRRAIKLRLNSPSGRQIYTLLSVRGKNFSDTKGTYRSRSKPASKSTVPELGIGSSTAPTPLHATIAEALSSKPDPSDSWQVPTGLEPSDPDLDLSLSELSGSSKASIESPPHSTSIPASVSMMKLSVKPPPSSFHASTSVSNHIPEGYRRDRHGFLIKSDSPIPAEKDSKRKAKHKRKLATELKWAKALKKWRDSQQSSTSIVNKHRDFIRKHCERGLPDSVRGAVWRTILRVDDTRDAASKQGVPLFSELVLQETEWSAIIQRDINRTFPNHFLFSQAKGQGQKALQSVLVAYSNYNPKVGYCQGMGFIVALFLMYMHHEQDAFWALVRLLDATGYDMEGLYSPNMPMVNECVYVFGRLLKTYLPRLESHFAEQGVEGGLYVPQLFITVFLYNMPFAICLRIWDRFLIDGFHVLYVIAIAIFKVFEELLLPMEFDHLMHFLKFDNNQETGALPIQLDPDELFRTVAKMSIKLKSVQRIQHQYRSQSV